MSAQLTNGVLHRLHQASALESATSPFATALPFSAALPLSPASPQADTPRFATLGHSNHCKSGLSQHAERSVNNFVGPSILGRSSHAEAPIQESAHQDGRYLDSSLYHASVVDTSSQFYADRLASAHTLMDLRGSAHPHVSSRGTHTADIGSPVRGALSSNPLGGAYASSSPYRSPAHAAAVSAVEQQLHRSLRDDSRLLSISRAVPSSPLIQTSGMSGCDRAPPRSPGPRLQPLQQLQSREQSPGRYAGDLYQKWSSPTHLVDTLQGTDSHWKSRQQTDALPAEPARHAHRSQLPHEPTALLRPLSQHMHPSPELDSLSQRLRQQKLAMGRQGLTSTSPAAEDTSRCSPGKVPYAPYMNVPARPALQPTYRQAERPNPSPSR